MSALAEAFVDIKPNPDSLGKGIVDEINKSGPGVEQASGRLGAKIGGVFSGIGHQIGGEFGELFSKLGDGIDHIAENGKKLGAVLGVGGGVAAGLGLALQHIGSADKQASGQLKASIEATGNAYSDYKDQIEEAIKSGEKYAHTAADTLQALQAITTATGDPAKAFRDLALAEDLAAAKHETLAQAAAQIALIYAGNTRILKAYGITTKNVDDALSQLAAKLHGQASASVDSFDGKIAVAKTRLEDWAASLGQKLGPAITLIGTAATIASGAVETFAVAQQRASRNGQSLLSSLKGAGLAAGGLGAALGVGIGIFALYANAQAKARQHAEDFAKAIEEDNGVLGENSEKLAANRLAADGGFEAGLKLGISQDQLTQALVHGGAALDNVRAKMDAGSLASQRNAYAAGNLAEVNYDNVRAYDKLRGIIPGFIGDVQQGVEEQRNLAAATDDSTTSTLSMNKAISGFPEASGAKTAQAARQAAILARQTALAAKEAASLSRQWDLLTGRLSNDTSEIASQQAISDVAKQLHGLDKNGKDASKSMSLLTDRGRENRQAVDDSIRAFQQQAQVLQDGTAKGNKAAADSYDKHYQALRKTLREAGLMPAAIDALIGAYDHIPAAKVTKITADTGQAKNAIADLLVQLQHVPRSVAIGISAKIAHGTAGGGKASGGPVYAGETYQVNEFGRETFTPWTNGTIHPAGGGSGAAVHIDHLSIDASGGGADVEQKVRRGINDAFAEVLRKKRSS